MGLYHGRYEARGFVRLAAAISAIAVMLIGAAPASAYEFRGNAFFARFGPAATAGQGLLVVDRIGSSAAGLNGAIVGLAPSIEQNDKEHVLSLTESRPNNRALLSITYDGGSGDDQIQFRGVSTACNAAAPPQTTLFSRITAARFSSALVNLTQTQLDSLRSVRVRNITMAKNLGCYPLAIIAILIG
jgi:hypothetical protein